MNERELKILREAEELLASLPKRIERMSRGDASRRTIDAPEDEICEAEDAATTIEKLLSIGPLREKLQGEFGDLSWVVPHIRRRTSALHAGRDEARAIMAVLGDGSIGNLRAHLRANPVSPECVVFLLSEIRRLSASQAASKAASKAASMKNKSARDFVAQAWATRADTGQSKASFARMIEHEVKHRFALAITPDRIARYWLPKG
jgi:hypothetical protein